MADYTSPAGAIPKLMAAMHRWQSRGGRAPADEGSIPLERDPTKAERVANAFTVGREEEAAQHPVLGMLGLTGGSPADPVVGLGPAQAMFLGAMAKQAPHLRMNRAQNLAQKGKDLELIYQRTKNETLKKPGISFGKDGMPRFEISDDIGHAIPSQTEKYLLENIPNHETTIGRALEHPELYANYPQLRDIRLKATSPKSRYSGQQHPGQNLITVNPRLWGDDYKKTLLHEIQHSIQDIEGWARGGNPSWIEGQVKPFGKPDLDRLNRFLEAMQPLNPAVRKVLRDTPHAKQIFKDAFRWTDPNEMQRLYMRLAGETEARNTASRMYMSPTELMFKSPYKTMDVPLEKQILNVREPNEP